MIVATLVLARLLAPPSANATFDARMRDSAAAAQALQGPLDGAWVVRGLGGGKLYILEIADPPEGAGILQAAWQSPEGVMGPVDAIARAGGRLNLSFSLGVGRGHVQLTLRRLSRQEWRGWMWSQGMSHAVRLMRR